MVKKLKKGKRGEVTQYLTRAQAIRKLQISLKEFRQICIIKGVYPREPKKKHKGSDKVYYHIKDINYLAHEKILSVFAAIKAHLKKWRKAKAKGDQMKADNLRKNLPKYTLQHVVKERYPSFMDAVRDMDDPVCLINLYASFPGQKTLNVSPKQVQECRTLQRHLNLYVIKSKGLRKIFFSLKGVYFQAEVFGHPVTWLQPYQSMANLPFDVDFRIMNTFLEFYTTMLRFVLYKLYSSLNLAYPPRINEAKEQNEYLAYSAMVTEAKEDNLLAETEEDKFHVSEEFKDDQTIRQIEEKNKVKKASTLFKGLRFFLSRETPIFVLEFAILACSGEVIYDLDNFESTAFEDETLTHVVTDRPMPEGKKLKTREHVQPQWIADSINNGGLLPVEDYQPGKLLPPHLSPFVDNKAEGYIPERQIEINKALKNYEEESIDEEIIEATKGEAVEEGETEESEEGLMEEEGDLEESIKRIDKEKKKLKKEQSQLAESTITKKKRRILSRINHSKGKKIEKIQKLLTKRKENTKKKTKGAQGDYDD